MLLFLFLITLFQVEENSNQADHYFTQITIGKNITENAWALNELAFSTCDHLLEISKKSQHYQLSDIYEGLECTSKPPQQDFAELKIKTLRKLAFKINTPKLFILYLLHAVEQDPDNLSYPIVLQKLSGRYLELAKAVINQEELLPEVLHYSDDFLIHFEILMGTNRSSYYTIGYLKEAISVWEEQEKSFNNQGIEYAFLLGSMMSASYLLDKYDLIYNLYEEFLSLKTFPDTYSKIRVLNAIDYGLYTLGYYDQSLKVQRGYSIPIARQINRENEIDKILMKQGVYLFSLGKYQESKEIYEHLYNNSQYPLEQYTLFNNLGINYLKLGEKNKYVSFQLKALNQNIPDEKYESLLNIYRNLFIYYTSINNINTALNYIEKAKQVAIQNADTSELALIDSYLGSFYWNTNKDSKKALTHLQTAKNILSPEDYYTEYINLLIEEGTILSEIDSLQQALSIFRETKELSLSKADTPNYIDALVNEVSVLLKLGDLKSVKEILTEIKIYSLDNLDFELLTKYYTVRSDYYYKTGHTRQAIDILKPIVVQVIERAKNNTDAQSGYWNIEDEYLDAFQLLIEMYTETGFQKKALIVLDELKTINDASLYNSPLVKGSKLSEKDLAEDKRLNKKLQDLRKQYLNAPESERFDLKTEIDGISAEREEILSQVNLNKQKALSPVWSIQRLIDKDELVLHFTEIGADIYITYLTFSGIKIKKVTLTKKEHALFSTIANELASGNTNLNSLYSVYQILELDDISLDFNQISVIPDNYLYRIPLEILPVQEPVSSVSFGSTRYMIEDYHFTYFTSLQEYENNQRGNEPNTQEDFAAFAISNFEDLNSINLPSLPFAIEEANKIDRVLTSFKNKSIYTGKSASKEAFKKELSTSRMVHVATHSEVSEQDPLFSTIYLSSENRDTLESSQALYAYELFDIPFNSEFIMLNSCSSGSGNYMQGTGIMGITRALRYAGAKSLALNLWSVNDKVASQFASDFYTYINQGETKSEAMRKAKLMQLKTANANPHYWGAYMLIGNPSPMTKKPSKPIILFSLLALTVLVTGYTTKKSTEAFN